MCVLLKDVLLFYYTQWCGFCSVLNHIIIQLARILQGNDSVTVARCGVYDLLLIKDFVFIIIDVIQFVICSLAPKKQTLSV